MRTSPLRAMWAEAGAVFRDRYGIEVAARVGDRAAEYRAIRDAAGLTDFSFVRAFRAPESTGMDFLDGLLAGNVAKVRFGRVLHTFLADAAGKLMADCYVANNDQEYVFLCESIVPDAELDALLQARGAAAAGLEDLTASHVLLSLDGYRAWEIARKLFGADVLGLPYLSIEVYPFGGGTMRLFRAGKTSEFGYSLLVPVDQAGAMMAALRPALDAVGGRLCGVDIHDDLRLEGRFFNIHAEGRAVGDPLALGLQWMIDFDKGEFHGASAIRSRRTAGVAEKIIGVATEPGVTGLVPGAAVRLGDRSVGRVVASTRSEVLGHDVGLALFPTDLAYSGLAFELGAAGGPVVRTLSMPPIMPKSLTVKLDEMG